MSDSPNQLVEHFFRHESANLVAVLTRAFGVNRLTLVEDMVQAAMLEAMNAWKHHGAPDNPAGWIHRVARNRILDALRREKLHDRAMALSRQTPQNVEGLVGQWLDEEHLPDSLLRMMFVCCHPAVERSSQIALTLKVLCGFSVGEIARGLLISREAAKKRIQRAKRVLAEHNVAIELPRVEELNDRLAVVHDVLYLMFNEGYSASSGHEPIRDDLCEEAARLCHLLCRSEEHSSPTTCALLALMLFHASRLESRIDADGEVVLLEDQDRSRWDRNLAQAAEFWLMRAGRGAVSKFHFEAAIAAQHVRAACVEETNWAVIVLAYDRLLEMQPSPLYVLNRAIARGQAGDLSTAFTELQSIRDDKVMSDYFLLDCAEARLHELNGDKSAAIDCYLAAMSRTMADHERVLVEKKLKTLSPGKK